MSKKKKNTSSLNSLNQLTNPALIEAAIYFSVYIENKEEYFQFLENLNDKNLMVREALIQSKVVPKYFDIVAYDQLLDLKTLIASLTLEVVNNSMHVIAEDYDEDNNNHLQMTYGEFLDKKVRQSDLAYKLAQLKKNNDIPNLITMFNGAEVVGEHFMMSYDTQNDFQLCPFNYQFPQKCVFALPFLILGNQNPIEKFYEKLDNSIELGYEFECFLKEVFKNDSIELNEFDLIKNADLYQGYLEEALFAQSLDEAIEQKNNTIIKYNDFPIFITFNDNEELDIRIAFLTFDMFAQSVLLPDEVEYVELAYSNHTLKRLHIVDMLDYLGLDYQYVLGQRVDFIHEPEMQNSVITKIKQRPVIENNVYFEESEHHVEGQEEDATIVSCARVETFGNPIVIITMQSEDHIVKQTNAYIFDIEQDNWMDSISDYFLSLGHKDIKHVAVDEVVDMVYCKQHLKINGFLL